MIRQLCCHSISVLAVSASGVAFAQRPPETDGVLAEIVVTAQKRESRLEDTPLAISAVSGNDLQEQQVHTLQDLASSLPSLDVGKGPNVALLAVRGVGSIDVNVATESRVAVHVDGVYVGRPEFGLAQFFDVDRVEYLRGPQGTLYGRNATAGVINVITNDPSSNQEGFLKLSGGNYSTFNVEGALNLPINDAWSGRIALIYNTHDGYAEDVTSGREVNDLETGGVRAKLKYDSSDFTLVLAGNYGKQDDNSGGFSYGGAGNPAVTPTGLLLGGTVPTDLTDIATDELGFPVTESENYGGSATADWQVGKGSVTAVVAYQNLSKSNEFETDFTSAPLTRIVVDAPAEQYSAEVRYHMPGERYDLVVGAYIYREEQEPIISFPLSLAMLGGPPLLAQGILAGGNELTEAYAAFADLRWDFTSWFYADVGVRYSYEAKEADDGFQADFGTLYSPNNPLVFTETVHKEDSWDSFDPKLTLGFTPSDNLLVYVTAARGFKSGGFNLGAMQGAFEPETITSYEAGLKFTSSDRRFVANISPFFYTYKNMQVNQVSGVLANLTNAGESSINGIELDARWTNGNFNIGAGLDLLDAEYDEYVTAKPSEDVDTLLDLEGNQLPQAPKYRARLDATYTWQVGQGDLSARAEGTWTDRIYFSQFNDIAVSAQSGRQYNAFVTYETGPWTLQAYGRNLGDERRPVYAQISNVLVGFPIQLLWNDPRTYGVSVSRRW
jgi:iron complex outermembrane recepter protein